MSQYFSKNGYSQRDLRLCYDILKGDPRAVSRFIEKGGDVNAFMCIDTPYPGAFDGLLYRTLNYSVRKLQEKQSIPSYTTYRRITPLMLAAAAGKNEIVAQLLAANANPTIASLHNETAADFTPARHALIKAGLRASELDYIAKTAPNHLSAYKTKMANRRLAEAVFRSYNEQAARAALADGADILGDAEPGTYRGGAPFLLTAIYGGYLPGLAVMLEAKPDLNRCYGKLEQAPIDMVYRVETLAMLVAAGMDIKRPLQSGRSLLAQMMRAHDEPTGYAQPPVSHYMPLIRAVLDKGYEIDTPDAHGDTSLMTALRNHKDNLAQALFETGADPSRTNAKGETAYTIACERAPNSEIVRLLQKNDKAQKEAGAAAHAARLEKENKALNARLRRMEKTLTEIKGQMAEMTAQQTTTPAANGNAAPKAKKDRKAPKL